MNQEREVWKGACERRSADAEVHKYRSSKIGEVIFLISVFLIVEKINAEIPLRKGVCGNRKLWKVII